MNTAYISILATAQTCASTAINPIFWLVPVASIIALVFAFKFYKEMKKEEEGTEIMRKIALHVRQGALAYLRQQYKIVSAVFLILFVFFAFLAYGLHVQNNWVPFAFITGGFFSGLAGFFGMKTATYASNRAAWAAKNSLDSGLRVAFRSGAVMGLVVVGLALLDISIWFVILNKFIDDPNHAHKMVVITTTMLTFGMGASLQALFARVGGGIFTKAADVGADLVGKVEAGIPEDDPRNPATIADNVGDNVGDVAGMGADLYESYCGSILATSALGAAAYMVDPVAQMKAILAPMIIGAVGVVLSLIGIAFGAAWHASAESRGALLGWWGVQCVLNFLWSVCFFYARSPWAGGRRSPRPIRCALSAIMFTDSVIKARMRIKSLLPKRSPARWPVMRPMWCAFRSMPAASATCRPIGIPTCSRTGGEMTPFFPNIPS